MLFLGPSADMTVLVNINESLHAIEDAQLSAVETQILAAVHSDGAFVDFHDRSSRLVRVLVTPASAIRIERLTSPVDATDGEEDICDLSIGTTRADPPFLRPSKSGQQTSLPWIDGKPKVHKDAASTLTPTRRPT